MDLDRLGSRSPVRLEGGGRQAAVLIPLLDTADGRALLFTKRAEQLSDHPGQMSFPGGGREPGDESLYQTALREGEEEIGLDPSAVTLLGDLDDIQTISEYVVRPFVVRIPNRRYEPNDREVAEVVVLPVSAFQTPENHEAVHRSRHGNDAEVVHYFRIDGYTVWGATGRLVVQLLEETTNWGPPGIG